MHSENKNQQIKWKGHCGCKHLRNGSKVIDVLKLSTADLLMSMEIKA